MRPSSSWGQNTPINASRHLLQRGEPPQRSGSSAAVPLSVYRELAAELQAKEMILNSLNTQNQQLAAQNQQLRQEIAIAVQSVLHLSQFAAATKINSTTYTTHPASQPIYPQGFAGGSSGDFLEQAQSAPRPTSRSPHSPSATQRVAGKVPPRVKKNSSAAGKLLTEQASHYRRYPQSESTEVKGWWLVLTIVLIMLTAFSAGFLIVRPLVQRR